MLIIKRTEIWENALVVKVLVDGLNSSNWKRLVYFNSKVL